MEEKQLRNIVRAFLLFAAGYALFASVGTFGMLLGLGMSPEHPPLSAVILLSLGAFGSCFLLVSCMCALSLRGWAYRMFIAAIIIYATGIVVSYGYWFRSSPGIIVMNVISSLMLPTLLLFIITRRIVKAQFYKRNNA